VGIDPLKRPAVFLDRDGVLNRAVVRDGRPYPPATVAELEVPPHTADHLERLRRAGFTLVVVTNQPDVARGHQERAVVEMINAELTRRLEIEDFRVCYHDDRSHCDCRKPAAGLLLAAALDRNLDLTRSFMIGDRWRDVEAGRRAGCRTVLIDHHYDESMPVEPDVRVPDLACAVSWILTSCR
jgi:D-glycero-D-manno-heptose 1,7-bisphosphate phosphatase